jgi:GNAT superfamily N-acetyltransferase
MEQAIKDDLIQRWKHAPPPGQRVTGGARASASFLVRRTATVWREDGLRTLVVFAIGTLGFRRVTMLARDLKSSASKIVLPDGVTLGMLNPGDVEEMALARPHGPSARRMREWLEKGCVCFVARRVHRVIATRWAQRREIDLSTFGRAIPLQDGEVCFFDAYTMPSERGRGIYRALIEFSDSDCRSEGCTLALTFTQPHNKPALRAAKAAGYHEIASMSRWRLGRWMRESIRPCCQ